MRIKRKIGITTGIIVALAFCGYLCWIMGSMFTKETGVSIYITFFYLPALIAVFGGIGYVISWALPEA